MAAPSVTAVATSGAARPAENAPLLELVLARVRLRARRRAEWLTHLHEGPPERSDFPERLVAAFDGRDSPGAEAAWSSQAAAAQPLNQELERVERALAGDGGARLRELERMFRLSGPEVDLLQTCLALALDPGLAPAFGHLQLDPARGYVTEPLAARLFDHGRRLPCDAGCPLIGWGLVTAGEGAAGEPAPLTVDPIVIAWLQGELRMDPQLMGLSQVVEPREPLAGWPVAATARAMHRAIERGSAARTLLVGPPGSGRRTFAAAVARQFGIALLAIDTSEIAEADWDDTFMRAQRLAVLGNMALTWHGSQLHRGWPAQVAPAPIQFVAADLDPVVPACEHAIDQRVDLPGPTLDERRRLWRAAIPESAAWPAREMDRLATRYQLNVGDIVAVARRAPANARDAAEMARELSRYRLGELGHLLECPFAWDDLVLPDRLRQALEDFAFEAHDRVRFWEDAATRRLFPRGTGLVALFGGPPGTGKTMAAQIVAAELEMDLFRIDLASVVSKYIGETAKHLRQIFARAARMNAVLLFDEADALFSKRTEVNDAHDRYANADTSYLLQLLEEYRGIVVLATNKKQNIDPAFIRRVRYVFDFPRPDVAERRRIWQKVIGELCGEETLRRLEATIEALGADVDLSGAQIKGAVLASIFAARRRGAPMSMAHLLRGLERELVKEGRTLGAREQERLLRRG
jgi:AAA+ superfamily predicted ATPase